MEPKYVIKDDKRKVFFSGSKLWDSVSSVLNVEDSGVSGAEVDLVMGDVTDMLGSEYEVSADRIRRAVVSSLLGRGHEYGARVYLGRHIVSMVNRGVSKDSVEKYVEDCLGNSRDRSVDVW